MNNEFLITKIDKVIFVDRHEYPDEKTSFNSNLRCNELIFHFSGKMKLHFNGKTFEAGENTLRFLPRGENNEYEVEREEPGDCIDVYFDTDIPVSKESFVIKLRNGEKIGTLFKKIFSVWVAKNDGYYYECISLLYKIFSEMQKSDYIPEDQFNYIRPAIDYIESNFLDKKITVGYLADICKISTSYLKKLFIKKFGIPPIKYIIQLKINYACDLLNSELYTTTRISEICGYDNVYYFSRQFKEYTGITPTEFKNKYKSSK